MSRFQVTDPHPGDWAAHKYRDLDSRQVTRVDPGDPSMIYLDILGEESGPFFADNYVYHRWLTPGTRVRILAPTAPGSHAFTGEIGAVLGGYINPGNTDTYDYRVWTDLDQEWHPSGPDFTDPEAGTPFYATELEA